MLLLATIAACRSACKEPLADACSPSDCPTFDELLTQSEDPDTGVPSAGWTSAYRCNGYDVYSTSFGFTGYIWYFDALTGDVVGRTFWQDTDAKCEGQPGSAYRTVWGDEPRCKAPECYYLGGEDGTPSCKD